MTTQALKRVSIYVRSNANDQRGRDIIKTQMEALFRNLDIDSEVELVARYVDIGVSGMIAMAEREAGGRLLRAAAAREFEEVWVYNLISLGRDVGDVCITIKQFTKLGIRFASLLEMGPPGSNYGN